MPRPTMITVTTRSGWFHLLNFKVVHGVTSSILCMPHKIRIIELVKVVIMFTRKGEGKIVNDFEQMRQSLYDVDIEAHRIYNHHIMENLTVNTSTVIVGHTFSSNSTIIDLTIQSSRSVAKVEVLIFSIRHTNICYFRPCLRSHLGHMWFTIIRLRSSAH